MTYIEIPKCTICRQDKAITTGQEVITFGSLTSTADPYRLELRIGKMTSFSDKVGVATAQIGVAPVVAFAVVNFEMTQGIEPVFVEEESGQLNFPTLFQIGNHEHSEHAMIVHTFAVRRNYDTE